MGHIRNNETNLIKIYQDFIGESRKIRIESLENKYFDIYNKRLMKNKSDKFKYSYFNIMINTINQSLVDLNLIAILLAVIYFRNFSVGDLALLISYSFIINDLSTYVSTFVVINNDLKVSLDSFNNKLNFNLCEDKSSFNVDNILIRISFGKVNVLIGDNGSGKSRILKKIASNREYCLVLKKSSVLSEDLYENIVTDGKPYRYREIVEAFSLNDLEDRKELISDELSGGQIDRIAIARALLSDKDVILIDNNLFSIDVAIRSLIFEEFENTGKIFLFTDTKYRNEYENFNIIYLKDFEINFNTKLQTDFWKWLEDLLTYKVLREVFMNFLKIILIIVGVAFTIFGYLIYFKEKYNLINGFEADYKSGRKTESYAKKVGLIELITGIILILIGVWVIIIK